MNIISTLETIDELIKKHEEANKTLIKLKDALRIRELCPEVIKAGTYHAHIIKASRYSRTKKLRKGRLIVKYNDEVKEFKLSEMDERLIPEGIFVTYYE